MPADHRNQHELIESDRLETGDGTRDVVWRADAYPVLVEALGAGGLRERAGQTLVAGDLLDDLAQLRLRDRPWDVLRALPGPRDGVEVDRHVRRRGARV